MTNETVDFISRRETEARAGRVAKVLRHMADKMLHQTDVPDEALRSTIDGWAGALHGAADLLDAGGPTRYETLPDLDKAGAESLGLTVREDDSDPTPTTPWRRIECVATSDSRCPYLAGRCKTECAHANGKRVM